MTNQVAHCLLALCSFKTNLPLQYSVEKLAAACLYHSARLNKIDLAKDTRIPGDQNFHDAFKITQAELDGELHAIPGLIRVWGCIISLPVLFLVQKRDGPSVPPIPSSIQE